jgi:peptidyl-prolyl cis-trans isomerase D
VKNISTTKAPAIKDFSPYVGKIKGQTAGDVNRVLPALKDKAEIEDRRQFNY